MYVLKMKFLPLTVQKLQPEQTHRQTDRLTNRTQPQLKLSSIHITMVMTAENKYQC